MNDLESHMEESGQQWVAVEGRIDDWLKLADLLEEQAEEMERLGAEEAEYCLRAANNIRDALAHHEWGMTPVSPVVAAQPVEEEEPDRLTLVGSRRRAKPILST